MKNWILNKCCPRNTLHKGSVEGSSGWNHQNSRCRQGKDEADLLLLSNSIPYIITRIDFNYRFSSEAIACIPHCNTTLRFRLVSSKSTTLSELQCVLRGQC